MSHYYFYIEKQKLVNTFEPVNRILGETFLYDQKLSSHKHVDIIACVFSRPLRCPRRRNVFTTLNLVSDCRPTYVYLTRTIN